MYLPSFITNIIAVGPLKQQASQDLDEPTLFSLVKDYVTEYGDWDWQKINLYFPILLLTLLQVQPLLQETGADSIAWAGSHDSDFSLKSAYSLIVGDASSMHDSLFSCVWKWRGPKRVKTCLWLLARQDLLMNLRRVWRHLSSDPYCLCQS